MINDFHTDVTTIVSEFETRLLEWSGTFKKVRRPFVHKPNKPWFDRECKRASQETRNRFKRFRVSQSVQDLNTYVDSKQQYKYMCKNKRHEYSRNTLNKLDDTINNYRLIWRELKRFTGKPRITPDIPLDAWYEHFSSVFKSGRDVDDNQRVPTIATDDNLDDVQELVFNSPITDDDIIESIKC